MLMLADLFRTQAMTVPQPDLFPPAVVTVERSPICMYQTHCGHRAAIGPPEDCGTYINSPIRCLTCGATGVRSERKD